MIFFSFFQLFVIVDLVISRIGFANGTNQVTLVNHEAWLNITSVCSYAFILPIIIICFLLGDTVPVRMVSITSLTLFWAGSGITLLGGGGHYGPDGF